MWMHTTYNHYTGHITKINKLLCEVENPVPATIHEKNVAASDIHILRNQPKVLACATPALSIK
jgi:hypothetical protein